MYQLHNITVSIEDRAKADFILYDHRFDYDDIRETSQQNSDGTRTITYWIKPHIYEDFENIVNEFIEAGIQIM